MVRGHVVPVVPVYAVADIDNAALINDIDRLPWAALEFLQLFKAEFLYRFFQIRKSSFNFEFSPWRQDHSIQSI
jgi:hypothetical protein